MEDSVQNTSPGHVFVVRGKLENIDVDAIVVPTDGNFKVESRWNVLWPNDPGLDLRKPDGWGVGSAAQVERSRPSKGAPDLWFIDVAIHGPHNADVVLEKIVTALDAVIEANSGKPAAHGRSRPLVGIPTLGVGGGVWVGFGES